MQLRLRHRLGSHMASPKVMLAAVRLTARIRQPGLLPPPLSTATDGRDFRRCIHPQVASGVGVRLGWTVD